MVDRTRELILRPTVASVHDRGTQVINPTHPFLHQHDIRVAFGHEGCRPTRKFLAQPCRSVTVRKIASMQVTASTMISSATSRLSVQSISFQNQSPEYILEKNRRAVSTR